MNRIAIAVAAAGCLLAAAPALAQQSAAGQAAPAQEAPAQAAPAQAAPAVDEWVKVRGTVQSTAADAFTLDHQGSRIEVRMDGYEGYRADSLQPGEEVIVTGQLVPTPDETRTIEASLVHVGSRNAFFYGNPVEAKPD